MYKKLHSSWYKSKLYLNYYKKDEDNNNKVFVIIAIKVESWKWGMLDFKIKRWKMLKVWLKAKDDVKINIALT